MGHWVTHPDNPHSGAAYYLTVTMVVLFSIVAMTSKSVCNYPTAHSGFSLMGAAHLAYNRL